MNMQLLVVLLVITLVAGGGLLLIARWRPGRVALLLAVIVVVVGLAAASVDVLNGIDDSRVDYHGKLDAHEILSSFQPTRSEGLGDPVDRAKRTGMAYLSSAQGEMTVPRPSSTAQALWSIQQLAPWLLAAVVLVLMVPILRAADRGDPFWEGATRRLTWVGALLLLGIPATAILRFVAAELASEGTSVAPLVEPGLAISVGHILPGVLVLVLAGIFRRGVELRELERHTI
ncbi:hypothetical protein BH20ACT17_BH20ACT17_20100 [soil metagenome]